MRARSLWSALVLASLLLAAGCGQVPTAGPAGPATPPGPTSYPPPPTYPTIPPVTAGPEVTAIPTTTPTPTTVPVPVLEYQPVPAELRQGERIAFLRDGDFWLVRPDGSALAQVTTSGNVTALYGWSPDCARVLLGVGNRPVPPESDMPGGTDVWIIQADGGAAWPLVQGLEVLSASWSPVDSQVAFQDRDGNVFLLYTDSGEQRALIADHTSAWLGPWSPDGAYVIVHRMPAPGQYGNVNLAILDVRAATALLLTTGAYVDSDAVWSADGLQILFRSNREEPHGRGRWWTIQADGQSLRLLNNEQAQQVGMAGSRVSRSPVSDQIVFWYAQPGTDTPTIWIMDFTGSTLRKLAEGGNPTWSPDGGRVAYASSAGGLRIIDVDGRGDIEAAAPDQSPLWYEPYWCR